VSVAASHKLKLGVLASHTGTTLQAILDAVASGELDVELAVVISNNSQSGALERAKRAGVETLHLSSATHPGDGNLDLAVRDALASRGVQVVFLAGYMKKLGAKTLESFRNRILNTHPALLPKFGGQGMYGEHVHEAVLRAKEPTSGATVHLVTAEYDTGPNVAQASVEVRAEDSVDTLAARVQAAERVLVVTVLQRIARRELDLDRVGN
jgi:phosphoribosylglycinamide formyltransferase 1